MKYQVLKLSLLATFFGTLAGLVGGIFIYNYFFTYTDADDVFSVIKSARSVAGYTKTMNDEAKRSVLKSLIVFYGAKDENSEEAVDRFYLDNERLGYGFAITTDGWVMASGKFPSKNLGSVVAFNSDGEILKIKKAERDYKSDAVFIRLDAVSLSPIAFGEQKNLDVGENLYAVNNFNKVYKVNFFGVGYKSFETKNDLYKLSENFGKVLFFENNAAEDLTGMPLVNYRGEVVGVVNGADTAVPFKYAVISMNNLFKNGTIKKMFFGAQYIDLSNGIFEKNAEFSGKGALVIGNKNNPGVIKFSPAWNAGIREGDVILKVGADELNKEYNLSERIAEYQIGDEVEFLILRNGKEEVLTVKLGQQM